MFNVEIINNTQNTTTSMTLDEILAYVYQEIDEAAMSGEGYESTLFVKGIIHLDKELLEQQVPDHIKTILDNSDLQSGLTHLMDDYDQLVMTIKLDGISLRDAIYYTKGE